MTQRAVVFDNRQGLRLFGVLHMPDAPKTDLAVILLSPGIKMRVGPQRLYKTLTDQLVRLGLPVLRFDFYGLGDSEGELTEELLKDVYNHIEVGRFVDDTIDAMDWMSREIGSRRFILSGLCGGAISGLLTGNRDPRAVGLLALAITPVLASRSADPALYVTSGQLADMRRTYIEKILSPKAWLRFLTMRTDYRVLWKSIVQPLRARIEKTNPPPPPPPEADNASPLFPPAFFNMLTTGRPMLLIFGGSDRLLWEYEEKFVARHRERLAALPALCDVHTIAHANHVLSFNPWQREMLDVSTDWLRRRFAADVAPADPTPAAVRPA